MVLRTVFCPKCGRETKINDEREFCFCVNCGFKIPIMKRGLTSTKLDMSSINDQSVSDSKSSTTSIVLNDLETKLKEVSFYLDLSQEKQEPHKALQENPMYYLKAQDLLLELSKEFPYDYRIWWELCKPIDYNCLFDYVDIFNQYRINEEYFDRALNFAELEKKRDLIIQRDQYEQNKRLTQNELEQKRKRIENEQQQILALEEDKKKQTELKRIAEEEAKRQEQINKEQEQQNKKTEQQKMQIAETAVIWKELFHKDFSRITETYFILTLVEEQKVIGIFRSISNILYLLSFRLDEARGNLYKEQSLPIQFDAQGLVLKFDNKALHMKNISQVVTELKVHGDANGNLYINQMELKKDKAYVNKIMQTAKKQIFWSNKTFL